MCVYVCVLVCLCAFGDVLSINHSLAHISIPVAFYNKIKIIIVPASCILKIISLQLFFISMCVCIHLPEPRAQISQLDLKSTSPSYHLLSQPLGWTGCLSVKHRFCLKTLWKLLENKAFHVGRWYFEAFYGSEVLNKLARLICRSLVVICYAYKIEYLKKIYFYLHVCCVFVCEYVPLNAGIQEGKKRVWDPIELELQVVVSFQIWLLGNNCSIFQEQ